MKKHLLQLWLLAKKKKSDFMNSEYATSAKIRKILIAIIAFFIIFPLLFLAILYPTLPDIDDIQSLVAAESSVILDRDGEVLYTIHGDENRKNVTLDKISPYAPQAIMAIEDDEFYNHSGVDFKAFLLAVCGEFGLCNTARGGSTLTQQFVKNAFLSPERSYTRKAKEIILSLQLESKYTKDEIMEMYLNRIPYGSNIYGVEVAAQTFFNKPASNLTIAESAILASIPKAPSYYSPYGMNKYPLINISDQEVLNLGIESEQDLVDANPEFISKGLIGKTYIFGEEGEERHIYIKGRVDFVLSRMVELGYISEEEAKAAVEEAKAIEFTPFREDIKSPHFVMYVRELVEEKYGKEQIEKGGLRITTTINGAMQDAADNAVEQYGERNETNFLASNASLVALDPENGQILAMVGSRDFWNDEIDGKVNVALRPRLPGSSFKPIVYAAAFLQGFAPSTVLYDVRTRFGSWYEPENFDGEFRGPVTLRAALAGSLNIPAVKTAYLAGVPNVLDLARKMGINLNQPDDWYGLSLGLGAGEARLIDMVGAYSTFANGGYKTDPVAILKIEDKNGNILEEYEAPKKRNLILDPQVAYLINNVLSDREARPDEYWRGMLTVPGHVNGAKTGTSNKKKNDVNYPFDVWTIGYTRQLAAGVWAGNANGDHLSLRASGLDVAAPIWKAFMTEATKEMENLQFEKPEGIKYVKISKRSGKLPSENTPEEDIVTGTFASFSVPRETDNSYQLIKIDKVSGKLATEFTPEGAIEEKAFFAHHSILPDNPNWENAVRKWAEENGEDEEAPTEFDDVHTADTMTKKPQISITSPSSGSKVSPPFIGVWVDINSPGGVDKVEYFWDDELVNTVESSPFKGNIEIPSSNKKGSSHTIKAIVYDELYRTSQSSITVKIGEDDTNPIVNFVYPVNDAKLPAGATMSAQVDARDTNGDILKIEFYLDGEVMDTVRTPPYVFQFTVPKSLGSHEIEAVAYDHAKNQATDKISIKSIESEENLSGNSRIIEPANNTYFDEGETVFIKAYISDEERNQIGDLIIMAKADSGTTMEIAKASGNAQTSTFIWGTPTAGRYELYLKMVLNDGKLRFSKRVPIIVR
ncbi:penicillin-binding protein [Candidatus Peregrinibacteria bacterium]|nr:penicillin-binding protein [Candidatus Peregrinibacteria bacterium]